MYKHLLKTQQTIFIGGSPRCPGKDVLHGIETTIVHRKLIVIMFILHVKAKQQIRNNSDRSNENCNNRMDLCSYLQKELKRLSPER